MWCCWSNLEETTIDLKNKLLVAGVARTASLATVDEVINKVYVLVEMKICLRVYTQFDNHLVGWLDSGQLVDQLAGQQQKLSEPPSLLAYVASDKRRFSLR